MTQHPTGAGPIPNFPPDRLATPAMKARFLQALRDGGTEMVARLVSGMSIEQLMWERRVDEDFDKQWGALMLRNGGPSGL
jgi:hypothetical protein